MQQLVLQHQLSSIGTIVSFGRPPNLTGVSYKKNILVGTSRACVLVFFFLQKDSPLVAMLWPWDVGQDTEGQTNRGTISSSYFRQAVKPPLRNNYTLDVKNSHLINVKNSHSDHRAQPLSGFPVFQAFLNSSGPFLRSVQIWWENLTTPLPRPLHPPLVRPIDSEYVVLKKFFFFKNFWGRTPLI